MVVTGEEKISVAEFTYCGLVSKDALRTLERKFGQPLVALRTHLGLTKLFSAS